MKIDRLNTRDILYMLTFDTLQFDRKNEYNLNEEFPRQGQENKSLSMHTLIMAWIENCK